MADKAERTPRIITLIGLTIWFFVGGCAGMLLCSYLVNR